MKCRSLPELLHVAHAAKHIGTMLDNDTRNARSCALQSIGICL